MGILRSETMKHGTLVLPNDRARYFIDILGRDANLQFVDMNASSMNRPYRKQVQRIDELERILRYLFDRIESLGAKVEKGHVDNFLEHDEGYSIDKVEEALTHLYSQFTKFEENNKQLIDARDIALEELALVNTSTMCYEQNIIPDNQNKDQILSQRNVIVTPKVLSNRVNDIDAQIYGTKIFGNTNASSVSISTLSGVLLRSEQNRLSRTLFRATRGNAYVVYHPIQLDSYVLSTVYHIHDINDNTQKIDFNKNVKIEKEKCIFVIYFQGTNSSSMANKIKKICQAFSASIYSWPISLEESKNRRDLLRLTISDKQLALEAYEKYFYSQVSVLLETARLNGNSLIEEWRLFCIKEKAIYGTLNMFQGQELAIRCTCWFAEEDENKIQKILSTTTKQLQCTAFLLCEDVEKLTDKDYTSSNSNQAEESLNILNKLPPTYIKTNCVTVPFQLLINTYGVPRYKEINPGVFTCITFPFLFGVMYGDMGHGVYLLIASLYLIYTANKYNSNTGAYSLRYALLLMSLFSIFCGLIYNDFFSIGFNLFGSKFEDLPSQPTLTPKDNYEPYIIGLDPAWKGKPNEMFFTNSFKMKLSVILGVLHMSIGIMCKGVNAIYFNKLEDFFFEFLPQIIFLLTIFGYMDLLIIIKWCLVPTEYTPNIMNVMLGMVPGIGSPLKEEEMFFSNQSQVQTVLILIAVLCVPIMLIGKPLSLYVMHKARKSRQAMQYYDEERSIGEIKHKHKEEEFESGEIIMHQIIETIEFVLSSVSNTASYLRLWALSLAHYQLSAVFYDKIMVEIGFTGSTIGKSIVLIFFCFAVFMCITTAIILLMDVLECFLHTLRLHWVEFQNKFFKGDGYLFKPFNHHLILTSHESDDN